MQIASIPMSSLPQCKPFYQRAMGLFPSRSRAHARHVLSIIIPSSFWILLLLSFASSSSLSLLHSFCSWFRARFCSRFFFSLCLVCPCFSLTRTLVLFYSLSRSFPLSFSFFSFFPSLSSLLFLQFSLLLSLSLSLSPSHLCSQRRWHTDNWPNKPKRYKKNTRRDNEQRDL